LNPPMRAAAAHLVPARVGQVAVRRYARAAPRSAVLPRRSLSSSGNQRSIDNHEEPAPEVMRPILPDVRLPKRGSPPSDGRTHAQHNEEIGREMEALLQTEANGEEASFSELAGLTIRAARFTDLERAKTLLLELDRRGYAMENPAPMRSYLQ